MWADRCHFRRRYGIKYSTFAYWRRVRRRKEQCQRKKGEERFLMIEAKPAAPAPAAQGLVVELPNGCQVSIRSRQEAQLAADLVNALGTGK